MDSDSKRIFRFTDASTPVPRPYPVVGGTGGDATSMFSMAEGSEAMRFILLEGLRGHGSPGRFFAGAIPAELTEEERGFLREKHFFETLPRSTLHAFDGKYVAVHRQKIVDSDRDLHALTDRFFTRFGTDAPLFISFVGRNKPKHFLPSPIRRRR